MTVKQLNRMLRRGLVLLIVMLGMASAQKFEDLALTPPMGWNSWNKFGCDVNEMLIIETADAMVKSGMKDAGYEYIVIDDCWQVGRDEKGYIVADPNRFPSGIAALADYMHAKGLKFGIYSCAGTQTCAGRPGSRGYEFQDAYTYAKWGVDYLKYDWCNSEGLSARSTYKLMSEMLKKAGRPMVFSICEWGQNKPWVWARHVGHLWRTTGDVYDCFDCVKGYRGWSSLGVMKILDKQEGLRKYAGPGHWNDPDMLEVGNGGMTENEDRAHFSMWCMLAAPLMAGNDLRYMSSETRAILTNKDAIAINQDALGIQGLKYQAEDGLETWVKPLSGGDWAVCFLNRSQDPKSLSFDWSKHVIDDPVAKTSLNTNETVYRLANVWTHKSMGTTRSVLKATVPTHDVLMIRLSCTQTSN